MYFPSAGLANSGRYVFAPFWLIQGWKVTQLVDSLNCCSWLIISAVTAIFLEQRPQRSLLCYVSFLFNSCGQSLLFIPELHDHVACVCLWRAFSYCSSSLISHNMKCLDSLHFNLQKEDLYKMGFLALYTLFFNNSIIYIVGHAGVSASMMKKRTSHK